MITLNEKINSKIKAIIICFFIAICTIGLRLVYLQLYLNKPLEDLCKRNFTRYNMVEVPRGDILDTNGNLLATNRPITNIFWQGTGNRKLTPEQMHTIEQLSSIIPLSHIQIKDLNYIEQHKKQLPLCTDVPFDQLSKVAEQFQGNANIKIKTNFERFYPHQMLASHVIGYIGTESLGLRTGKMGLERYIQQDLVGEAGIIQTIVNSFGVQIEQKQIHPFVPGKAVRTTIDLAIQKMAECALPEEFSGACVIMESSTGALRALVSRPTFDPSCFLKPIELEWWKSFSENRPFLNRAYNACYPPASLFKIVTITAGLEEGIIQPGTTCFCSGEYAFGGQIYHCHKEDGHGRVAALDALAQSCNILFLEIGKRISIDTLAGYAAKFGLGERTGFSFPEKRGLIPTSEWKRSHYGTRWWQGETLCACLGQSFMLVTPLQIARMFSGIATGYLPKPRLLEDEEIERQPLAIHSSTRDFLQRAMNQVIKTGTARRLSNIQHLTIFGKTGTAQTGSKEKQLLGKQFISHGWFVASIKYKNQPFLTIVILLEHAGSSSVAVQVAKDFIIPYKKYIDKNELEIANATNQEAEEVNILDEISLDEPISNTVEVTPIQTNN